LPENKVPAGKYWVAGESIGCPSDFHWCDMVNTPQVNVDSSYMTWKPDQLTTDPLKECTTVEYKPVEPYFIFSRTDCNKPEYLNLFETKNVEE
jgi:hypothetical protein